MNKNDVKVFVEGELSGFIGLEMSVSKNRLALQQRFCEIVAYLRSKGFIITCDALPDVILSTQGHQCFEQGMMLNWIRY